MCGWKKVVLILEEPLQELRKIVTFPYCSPPPSFLKSISASGGKKDAAVENEFRGLGAANRNLNIASTECHVSPVLYYSA